MPAAIAIPLITGAATAGAQVVGAKLASNAAQNAARTQSQAADRALAYQQQLQQQQRQDFTPYQQAGASAMGQLGRLANAPQPVFNASAPMGQLGLPPQQAPQPPQNFQQAGQNNQGMVKVQAPDGEIRQYPASAAQMLIARGAKLVQ